MAFEGAQELARGVVPDSDGLVVRPTGQGLAIRRPAHAQNIVRMAFEGAQELARGSVPDSDGSVVRPAGQGLAIRRPAHAQDPVGMAFEGAQELARGVVPDSDGAVARPAGQGFAIRRPSNRIERIRQMRGERPQVECRRRCRVSRHVAQLPAGPTREQAI